MEALIVLFEALIWGWVCFTNTGTLTTVVVASIVVIGIVDAICDHQRRNT